MALKIKREHTLILNFLFFWMSACTFSEEEINYQVMIDKDFSADQVFKQIQLHELKKGSFNAGITPHLWWMNITIPPTKSDERYYLKLNSPHINRIEVYYPPAIEPANILGDHMPFSARPYWDKDLILPLEKKSNKPFSIVLKIIKPGETLILAPMLLSETQLLQKKSFETLLIGSIVGWMMLMFVGALVYAIFLREMSGILYALFILSLTFWLVSHWGLAYQYFWPDNSVMADKSRPIFNLLTNMFFLLLLLSFFPPLIKNNWLVKALYFIIGIHFLLALDTIFRPMSTINLPNKMFFLKMTFLFSILVTFIIVGYLGNQYKAGKPYAGYYLLGIATMLGFNLLVHFQQIGLSLHLDQFFFDFGSSFGMLGETVFITAAFINKAADYKVEREKLQVQVIENDKKMVEKLIQVQETERHRIARDLHDSIGSMLASIYLKASQIETQFYSKTLTHELKDLVSKSIVEARSISHNLTPPHLEEIGLKQALGAQLKLIQDQTKLPISYHFQVSKNLSQNLQLSIYRICSELVHNALKHAKATELMVQLIEEEEYLVMIVEDDGIGFDTKAFKNGIGLRNIQDRVSYWKGNITIDSNAKGTTVVIKIPLVAHYE